jgi:hypothetical protein
VTGPATVGGGDRDEREMREEKKGAVWAVCFTTHISCYGESRDHYNACVIYKYDLLTYSTFCCATA